MIHTITTLKGNEVKVDLAKITHKVIFPPKVFLNIQEGDVIICSAHSYQSYLKRYLEDTPVVHYTWQMFPCLSLVNKGHLLNPSFTSERESTLADPTKWEPTELRANKLQLDRLEYRMARLETLRAIRGYKAFI